MVRRFNSTPSAVSNSHFTRVAIHAEQLESRETPSISTFGEEVWSQPLATAPAHTGQVAKPLLAEPRGRFAVGTEGGGTAQVNVYDAKTNALLGIINPFGRGYTGAVTVATGDVTGDGVEDIVVGAGRGLTPQVKVFDGVNLRELGTLMPYSVTFTGGVSVAVGDVNGDGRADIVTGAGIGSAPHVKMFSGTTLFPTAGGTLNAKAPAVKNYFAFETSFRGGISVAVGDINGDGKGDIVVGKKAGQTPQVKAFSGKDDSTLVNMYAFLPNYTGGVSVAVGDVTGDGKAEIVAGKAGTGPGTVRVFQGDTMKAEYTALEGDTGVRVALQDIDGDGVSEVIAASGTGTAPKVKVLSPMLGASLREFPGFLPMFNRGLSVG